MTLRYGDRTQPIAFWLAGDETPEIIRQFMADAKLAIEQFGNQSNVMVSPTVFTVKLPGEPQVPDTPKWLELKCAELGRRSIVMPTEPGQPSQVYTAPVLLVAEATVLGRKPEFRKRTFVGDLSQKDLASLRAATRRTIKRPLSDIECDDIIEHVGPDAAFDAVMGQLEAGATKH